MNPPRLPVASNRSSSTSAIWAGVPAMVFSYCVAASSPCSKNSSRVISVSSPSFSTSRIGKASIAATAARSSRNVNRPGKVEKSYPA